jgi:hypothetical protein
VSPPRGKRRRKPPPELEAPLPLPVCRGMRCDNRSRIRSKTRSSDVTVPTASRLDVARSVVHFQGRRPRMLVPSKLGPVCLPPTILRLGNDAARRMQNVVQNRRPWNEDVDPNQNADWFREAIVPKLGSVSLTQIAKATGLSTSAASKIRSGRNVPHRRHWQPLRNFIKDSSL